MFERRDPDYARQVFINCPFDEDYWPIFQAVVFTVRFCGFTPRCALEESNAGEERLAKILRIISDCHLGIHDLSRKRADSSEGFARFNMPFEMGLFQGAAHFGSMKKAMLVMEEQAHDYKRFISDLSGRDIYHHEKSAAKAISIVRDWLNAQRISEGMPGGREITRLYETFQRSLPKVLRLAQLHKAEIQFPHFINWYELIEHWLDKTGHSSRL